MYDIIFVKCRKTSSAVTCGDEVSDLLNSNGISCKSVWMEDFKLESTKSYVFLKPRSGHIDRINKIPDSFFVHIDIIDLDLSVIKKVLASGSDHLIGVDSFICRTEEYADVLFKLYPDSKFDVIPHYISPSFRIANENKSKFKPGFFGSLLRYDGGPTLKKFLSKYQYKLDRKCKSYPGSCPIGEGLRDCNMHISIRNSPYKPSNKIIQAAYSESNILCSYNSGGAIDMLGEGYPYLCEDNVESASEVLKQAEEDFGGSQWMYGLDVMKSVLNKYGDDAIISRYSNLTPR